MVDNNAEDTLTYSPKSVFFYNQNKTGVGFSHDDVVTVLHPVIVVSFSIFMTRNYGSINFSEKIIGKTFLLLNDLKQNKLK